MTIDLIILIISLLTVIFMMRKIKNKNDKNILYKYFFVLNIALSVHLIGLILQILFSSTGIPPIYFDYITYTGGSFTPVILMMISLLYLNSKTNEKKLKYLCILPVITLLALWTNDLHHLFYEVYSINISENVYGPFFYVYSIYSYLLIFISIVTLVVASMKKSGFFSIQTFLMILGGLVPSVINIMGAVGIINITIYITPTLFIISSICYYLAIFKYKALNITPVAFRTVIDTMSDAYVVISDDGTVADTNKTFEKKFKEIFDIEKDDNLFDIIEKSDYIDIKELKKAIKKTREKGTIETREYHFKTDVKDKYFEVDIHPISAKSNSKEYIGTLLLFKDISQHKEDIKEIEEKQDIIVKQQQLVSIGELAGGVAHDINTPISAIKTGVLMLSQMSENRTEEEKEVLQRMDNCATKIINIVNSMRNQIRNLGSDTSIKFKISSVVDDIKVITYHEVSRNKSEVVVDIKDDLEIKGDPTKLGQVLTNLIVNAAQAYKDKGGKIEITVEKAPNNMAMIKVADYAGGLDESITPYIFKNILTTKGTIGTGLGLYLAYSVIKGNFNGDITFDTAKGEGTTFYIVIPRG